MVGRSKIAGNTQLKFLISPPDRERLAELVVRWECTQTDALRRALREAHVRETTPDVRVKPPGRPGVELNPEARAKLTKFMSDAFGIEVGDESHAGKRLEQELRPSKDVWRCVRCGKMIRVDQDCRMLESLPLGLDRYVTRYEHARAEQCSPPKKPSNKRKARS